MKLAIWRILADAQTNILPADMNIGKLLVMILNILLYGIGAAAVLGVIISGIQYMTSQGNEQKMTAAKNRLIELVIGLVAWAVLFVVLKWLIPGFDLNNISTEY